MGVHRQEEHAPFGVGHVEFRLPDREHIVRRAVRPHGPVAAEAEVGGVVQDPLHRQFHHAGRLPVRHHLVGPVVRHQAGVVEESQVPDDVQGVRAVVPRRGAEPHRAAAGEVGEGVHRLLDEAALLVGGEQRVPLVDPAVDPDFVPGVHDPVHILPVDQRADRRDEERGADAPALEQVEDPGKPGARAVLAAGEVRGGGVVVPERDRLVVEVERERDRDPRAPGPGGGGEPAAGANGLDGRPPLLFGPLPGGFFFRREAGGGEHEQRREQRREQRKDREREGPAHGRPILRGRAENAGKPPPDG